MLLRSTKTTKHSNQAFIVDNSLRMYCRIGLHIKNADNNHTIRRYYIKYSTLTSYSTEMTDRSRWPIGNTADLQSAMPRFDNRTRRMLFTRESH